MEESKNMWIVKPAAKSRGRGIMTFGDLSKLLRYVEAGNGLSTQWIVQKYMENALIIAKRKFDLRQWVLVTDWNPLTIYFYHECYARFSVEEYSTSANDLENAYVHLVNNSIGKNSDKFGQSFTTESGEVVEGYMMNYTSMVNYFKHVTGGKDIMREVITPRLKDIAKWSLMCASEMVEHRKNSWELYGFDFMIDSDFNAWLIEINSSPACDYSTKTTETYVQAALVELLSVVLDTREYEAASKKDRENKGLKKPDTGGWECIYKGPLLEKPVSSIGADIIVTGNAIKLPVKRFNNETVAPAGGSYPAAVPSTKTNPVRSDSIRASNPSQPRGNNNTGGGVDEQSEIRKPLSKLSLKTVKSRGNGGNNGSGPDLNVSSMNDDIDDEPNGRAPNTFTDSDCDSLMVEEKVLSSVPSKPDVKAPVEGVGAGNSSASFKNNNVKSAVNNKAVSSKGQPVAPIAIKTFTMDF